MKRVVTLLTCLTAFASLNAQTEKRIAIDLLGRYDKHADYVSRYGDRSYTNNMKLLGAGGGLQFKYFQPLDKLFSVSLGAGYSQLRVDKIRSTTPWSDNVSVRTIDYTHPDGIEPAFHTDKYRYNNLAFSIGLNFESKLNDRSSFTFSGDFTYLYTISQFYHVTYTDIDYKTKTARPLGFGINALAGFIHKFGRNGYYLNPNLVLPVYQQLTGDEAFRESNGLKINKWLNGIGCSISVGKHLY